MTEEEEEEEKQQQEMLKKKKKTAFFPLNSFSLSCWFIPLLVTLSFYLF